ncbi:MAG: hypothetical protein Q9190_001621 [Brigantiaea leucoxantha]
MSSSSTNSSPQLSPIFLVPQLHSAPHSKKPSFSAEQLYYDYPSADCYIHSNPSTPSYDHLYPSSLPDSQYMPTSPSQNPPIRVQQSNPHYALSSPHFNSPPSRVDGIDFATPWDSYEQASHLNPHALQHPSGAQRFRSHKRISSDSSVGSVGPNSPYTQTQAYPHIVDTESASVSSPQFDYYDVGYSISGNYSKPFVPPHTVQQPDSFLAPIFNDFNPSSSDSGDYMAVQEAMRRVLEQQGATETNNHPHLSSRGSENDEFNSELARMQSGHRSSMTKLDRTMSDICADELYNPQMSAPAAPAPQPHQQIPPENLLSPQKSQFSEMLQVAKNRSVSARSASPTANISRDRSPFRPGSKCADEEILHSGPNSPAPRVNSAAQLRAQQKAEADARVLAEHQPRPIGDFAAPRTVSPKEVALDFHEAQDDAKLPLFQDKRENQISTFASNTPNLSQSDVEDITSERSHSNMAPRRQRGSNFASSTAPGQSGSNFTFMPPSGPHSAQIPQEYPFIPQIRRQSSSMRSTTDQVPDFPAQLASMESSKSESTQPGNTVRPDFPSSAESTQQSPSSPGLQRPSDTTAATGSYTCVSAGCSARFDTSAKLQKHRREAHRTSSPRPTAAPPTTSSTTPVNTTTSTGSTAPANRNQQPGPHKCERINPSTGKPCNTVFSRSYDLTRHEDTIHNNRKQKVRCHLCTEEKTFSRNDALTRHMRVVHPDVDFPGKTKRRGG